MIVTFEDEIIDHYGVKKEVKEQIYSHAKKRFFERYGEKLNLKDYNLLIKKCQKMEGIVVGTLSRNHNVRILYFKKKYLAVLYDNRIKMIETFLPTSSGVRLIDWINKKRKLEPFLKRN